jgi:hypothetical protein
MPTNFKQLMAKKRNAEKTLRCVCPRLDRRSGLYILTREDEEGKYAYIGKAIDLLERMISHLIGYQQHIDVSLKKRGFKSTDNPYGWVLDIVHFPKEQLDEAERNFIARCQEAGFNLYNVESGGTTGKTIIGERKPPKTYRDGLVQGRRTLAREIKHILDTHFDIVPKKESKISAKALEKLRKLLESEDD